jgi:dTDP-4-amino-4,6-dideoxygalactose transaminase
MKPLIQLADFKQQWAASRAAYLAAVERVGESGWLVLGNEVLAFEQALATSWGCKHAVGVASGLDALEIAFRCLGARHGDIYLTTPLSAFASTLAILRVGGVPVFADVDEAGQLDLASAEIALQALRNDGRKARFFVPVHLYGHAMDLEGLASFARSHELILVEDCAQAIGARSGGRWVGSASPMFATSFYPTKNLGAFGDAGAVLTDDRALADTARQLRDYGQSQKYVHDVVGMNSRLDELQAALLRSVQLPLLQQQTARRTAIADAYRARIRHPKLVLPAPPRASASVWHLFPVLVEGDRERFRAHLASHGVSSAVHYPRLIPHQKALTEAGLPSPTGEWPMALRFADHEVTLPIHPFLDDAQVEQVIAACNAFPEL